MQAKQTAPDLTLSCEVLPVFVDSIQQHPTNQHSLEHGLQGVFQAIRAMNFA
jgi:hypothetical protein